MPDTQQDILQFLPHRPPFVMIDNISAEPGQPVRSSFRIRPDNVLLEAGFFSEGGLVENMAQTAGAAAGIQALASGKTPVLGYIGAVKDLMITELPRAGETLDTEVIFVHQVMQAQIVQGKVTCEGRLLATCELKIFLQS
jgi:predicted hotdog family 3-hydroxylacyl-ACP dehydratase